MARLLLLLLLLAALAVACGGGEAQSEGASLQPLAALSGGDPLPEAELPLLDGEGTLSTSDLRGQPALLNFWATWCPFCVEEMPALEEVHREVAGEIRFVGIDREDNLDKARHLATETGVTYELVVDDDGSFFRAVQARGMPTTVFVDADGTIVYRHAGPLTAEQLKGLLAEHLNVGVSAGS